MRLRELCERVLKIIEENPAANWAGYIVVPAVGTYGAQDFIDGDKDLPVEVYENNTYLGCG